MTGLNLCEENTVRLCRRGTQCFTAGLPHHGEDAFHPAYGHLYEF